MPKRRNVALICELVPDEGVEERVGESPGLAREDRAEVRVALAHDLLEADHGGALGGYRHVLGGCGEPDDVCHVVGDHRLVPCDAQLELRVGESHPHQHVHHPCPIVVIRDSREELVERFDCRAFTLTTPIHICGTRAD